MGPPGGDLVYPGELSPDCGEQSNTVEKEWGSKKKEAGVKIVLGGQ
jgi:hypothetical protein